MKDSKYRPQLPHLLLEIREEQYQGTQMKQTSTYPW